MRSLLRRLDALLEYLGIVLLGAIVCVYALLITFLVYRESPFSETRRIPKSTFATVSSVLFIIAAASAFGAMLSILEVPEMLADAMLGVSENPVVILLLMNVLLLVAFVPALAMTLPKLLSSLGASGEGAGDMLIPSGADVM